MGIISNKYNNCQIRIANIIEDARIAGPQIRMIRIAPAIKNTINTTILMPKKNSRELQKKCKELNIKYFSLSLTTLNKNLKSIIQYLIYFPNEVLALSRIMKKKNFDIIHVSGGSWQYKGVLAAKLANIKIIWHLNDTYIALPLRLIFNLLIPLVNGFIFSAERTKFYYFNNKKIQKPNFTIHPPVDTSQFNPFRKYHEDKQLIRSWKSSIVVGTVCNINKNKDIETIIAAALLLKKKFNNVRFVILGPVLLNQKRYYKNLLKTCNELNLNNFEFIGKRNDIRSLVQRFDIFVMTSKFEAGPMALFEAMSMNKPIISTDVGDVKKFVKNGFNGFLFKVGDTKTLAKRIKLLIKDPKLRIKFGRNARKVIKDKLDIQICAKLHDAAYKSVFLGNR